MEKKKDKTNQKMDKSKYNIIVNTSSEVNEKFQTSTSSSIIPSISNDTLENNDRNNSTNDTSNMTHESVTILEGIGEATPVLDTSMLEAVSSNLVNESSLEGSLSSSSTPTESLPSVSSTSTTEVIVTSSTTSSSKTVGEERFLFLFLFDA